MAVPEDFRTAIAVFLQTGKLDIGLYGFHYTIIRINHQVTPVIEPCPGNYCV